MKSIFISLSLLLVSCINQKLTSPHHYEKYAVQIIEVTAPIKENRLIHKSAKGILSQNRKVIDQYTVAYLPLGNTVTVDETTPLLAAKAIGFKNGEYIIHRQDEEVYKLGRLFTVTLGDEVKKSMVELEYNISNQSLLKVTEEQVNPKTTLKLPVFDKFKIAGTVSAEVNRWQSLGVTSSNTNSSTYLLIRIIPPSLEGIKSIIPQQISHQ